MTGLAYARLVDAVFGADATAAAPLPGSTASLDSADVSCYADQFSYDSQNRVDFQSIVGTGASSLNGSTKNATNPTAESAIGTMGYAYQINNQIQGVGIGDWSQETTISLADGTTQNVYTNFAGEPLLSGITDNCDAVDALLQGLTWNTFFEYDLQGRLLLTAMPSTGITPNRTLAGLGGASQLAASTKGLIDGTDYYTTTNTNGAVAGYAEIPTSKTANRRQPRRCRTITGI